MTFFHKNLLHYDALSYYGANFHHPNTGPGTATINSYCAPPQHKLVATHPRHTREAWGKKNANKIPKLPNFRIPNFEDDDSDEESAQVSGHQNKYPVIIEEHFSPDCRYVRQKSRSGHYIRVTRDNGENFCLRQKHDELDSISFGNGDSADPPQIVRLYRKDLVR